jgi:phosphatidylglycerol:prolipoprotein diacylglycerol transferase
MLPSLHLFDGISIPSYGLMLFIAFVVGITLLQQRIRKRRLLPDVFKYNRAWLLTDLGIVAVVLASLIWAVFFASTTWAVLRDRPAGYHWAFRLAALIVGGYLAYSGIAHIRLHIRKKEIESVEFITYLALWILFSAIAGSRLLYVAFHWSEFAHDIVGRLAFWRGGLQGLIFYGGLIGALVMGLGFASINRVSLLRLLDAAIPSIVLGEFFTRIGCFLNGCCFGQPCNLPWALRFPPNSPVGATSFWQERIHPTQLYSSLAGLILFGIALILERRRWRPGVLFGVMIVLYAGFRFGIDFVRYYENAANFWINQSISLGLAAVGIAVAVFASRRMRNRA